MNVVVPALILLALAILLLGVKVFFVKGGKFPSGHAHDLPARRREATARLNKPQNPSQT